MGFISNKINASMQKQNFMDNFTRQSMQLLQLKQQRMEQEAERRLSDNSKRVESLDFWKMATPEIKAQVASSINEDRATLKLDPVNVLDMEDGIYNNNYAEDIFKMQTWAKSRVPFSFVKKYFGDKYGGDWLNKNHVTTLNGAVVENASQPTPPAKPQDENADKTGTGNMPTARTEAVPGINLTSTWDSWLGEEYAKLSPGSLDIADAVNVGKLINTPGGVGLILQTRDGKDTLRALGSTRGLSDDLFSSDFNGYVTQLQQIVDKDIADEKKEKNAKVLISKWPTITRARQSGMPVDTIVSQNYQELAALGYDGSVADLTRQIETIPQTTPYQDENLKFRTEQSQMRRETVARQNAQLDIRALQDKRDFWQGELNKLSQYPGMVNTPYYQEATDTLAQTVADLEMKTNGTGGGTLSVVPINGAPTGKPAPAKGGKTTYRYPGSKFVTTVGGDNKVTTTPVSGAVTAKRPALPGKTIAQEADDARANESAAKKGGKRTFTPLTQADDAKAITLKFTREARRFQPHSVKEFIYNPDNFDGDPKDMELSKKGIARFNEINSSEAKKRGTKFTPIKPKGADVKPKWFNQETADLVTSLASDKKKDGRDAARLLREAGADNESEINYYMNRYFWGQAGRPKPGSKK